MADLSVGQPNEAPIALSPERYLAWLYSSPGQQEVLAALCGIEAEVASSLRRGIEHQVAHARLQWWHDECARTSDGSPVHPLTRALAKASGSPVAGISGFVDTAVWDLASATFETRKELTAYCDRWGAAMFESAGVSKGAGDSHTTGHAQTARVDAALRTLGAADGPAPPHPKPSPSSSSASLRALGAAVREIELLAGLASEARAGRLRVPLDELERAGVDSSCIATMPWPAPLTNLLRERQEALRATLANCVSQVTPDSQASVRGLMVWAALAWHQSWRAQRALPNAILPRRYHPLLDGWRAWRAARRATAGTLRLA